MTEGNALYATFALALAIIFLVLAIQFESVRDPLVIMVSVPLAISGALIALAWGMATMNIYSQVGLITLVGLITKHGILICEVAKDEQLLHGLNRMQAVMQAAKVRLRPILMTTAAMIAGLIPLLYASGAGRHSASASASSSWRVWPSAPCSPCSCCRSSTPSWHPSTSRCRNSTNPSRQKPRAVTDPSPHKKGPERGLIFIHWMTHDISP